MATLSARESIPHGLSGRIRAFTVLVRTFGGYRRNLGVLVVLGFLGAILDGIGITMIIPFVSFLSGGIASAPADLITRIVQQAFTLIGLPFEFRILLVFMAVLFSTRAAALIAFSYIRARIGANFMGTEMGYLFSGTLTARWPFLLKQEGGYLQNTMFWDVKRSASLLDVIAQAAQSWSGFLVYLLIAFTISPMITGVTVLAAGLFLFLFKPLVRKTGVLAETTSINEKLFSQHLIEHLGGLKNIKVYGKEKAVYETGKIYLVRLQDAFARSALVQSLGTVLIQPFSFLFMLAMFALSYATGSFNLAAFAATLYLIQKIFTYVQSGQASLHSINELVPYAANILAFKEKLQEEGEELVREGKPFTFSRSIDIQNLSFAYVDGTPVLSDVSLSIPRGQVVALIGPSGAGKSSVADLMLRLFTPNAGMLSVDSVPAQEIDLADWRSKVRYVTQESFVRNASVTENIRFYRPALTDEDIVAAARQANIYDVIQKLPEGFDTILGDRGVLLSGGQRQRVMLARALAGAPEVLVLDEATSALDAESERLIQESIRALRGTVTVLVIAHRLTTIRDADRVYVLENGKVTEEGTPDEMLARPESYFARHIALSPGT